MPIILKLSFYILTILMLFSCTAHRNEGVLNYYSLYDDSPFYTTHYEETYYFDHKSH
jgi:hypothetical protein